MSDDKYDESDLEEDVDEDEYQPKPRIKIGETINKPIKPDEESDEEEEDEDDESDAEVKSNGSGSEDGGDDEDDDMSDIDEEDKVPTKENKRSTLPQFPEFDDDMGGEDVDDDDMSDDDNYLQKFDESTKHNIISEFHPEMQVHNYDEIDILTTIVRDPNGIIVDPMHRTLPFITKYERARVLGERAKQLNSGAKAFIEVEPTLIDGYLIALKEYDAKKIPFIIKRPLPNGGCEYWRFRDLEI
jgi:DNA-directed RNA polymerase subunit K/omega